MNKAKAYKRLKKKQKHLVNDWTELSSRNERVARLPLQDIKQVCFVVRQRSNSATDLSMFGIRSFNTLGTFNEAEELESGSKVEPSKVRHSLPNISKSKNLLLGDTQAKPETLRTIPAKVSSLRRPGTTANDSQGYTLLQAKLDALILPNPVKRKASRSFSGSSSGFHGRKITIGKKDHSLTLTRPRAVNKIDEHSCSVEDSVIQFPIASKMRQLLTIEPIEQPVFKKDLPSNILAPRSPETKAPPEMRSRAQEVSKAAKFYFPSYANQKQKSLKISTSTDHTHRLVPTSKAAKPEQHITKQVSFVDDSTRREQSLNHQQQTISSTPPEHQIPPSGLMLTTKNLEMYNTLAMTSDLSVPSEDDSRIACWVKDRQNWTSDMCENIQELKDNPDSASLDDDSTNSSTYIR